MLLHFLFYLAEPYFSILLHFECFWCRSQVIFFYIVWYSPSGWCLPLSFNIEYRWRAKGAGNLLCHSLWRNNISLNHHHQGEEFTIQFLSSNHCQFWDFSKPYLSFFHHLSRKLWWIMGTYPKWTPYSMTDEDKVWGRNLVWIMCIHPYLNENPDGLKVKTKMWWIMCTHPYLVENLDGLRVKT